MAHDECQCTNVKFRERVGLVLLDLGDRELCAMELEGWYESRHFAAKDLGQGF